MVAVVVNGLIYYDKMFVVPRTIETQATTITGIEYLTLADFCKYLFGYHLLASFGVIYRYWYMPENPYQYGVHL